MITAKGSDLLQAFTYGKKPSSELNNDITRYLKVLNNRLYAIVIDKYNNNVLNTEIPLQENCTYEGCFLVDRTLTSFIERNNDTITFIINNGSILIKSISETMQTDYNISHIALNIDNNSSLLLFDINSKDLLKVLKINKKFSDDSLSKNYHGVMIEGANDNIYIKSTDRHIVCIQKYSLPALIKNDFGFLINLDVTNILLERLKNIDTIVSFNLTDQGFININTDDNVLSIKIDNNNYKKIVYSFDVPSNSYYFDIKELKKLIKDIKKSFSIGKYSSLRFEFSDNNLKLTKNYEKDKVNSDNFVTIYYNKTNSCENHRSLLLNYEYLNNLLSTMKDGTVRFDIPYAEKHTFVRILSEENLLDFGLATVMDTNNL